MATRLGMADNGRCTTLYESGRILNDGIQEKAGIDTFDSYTYRQYLQRSSPEDIIPEPTCSLYSYVKDFDIVTTQSKPAEDAAESSD